MPGRPGPAGDGADVGGGEYLFFPVIFASYLLSNLKYVGFAGVIRFFCRCDGSALSGTGPFRGLWDYTMSKRKKDASE